MNKKLHLEIYKYFIDYFFEHKEAPTFQQIGNAFGLRKERVAQILKSLAKRDYLLKKNNEYHKPYTPNLEKLIELKEVEIEVKK